jgi:hypothetical protein
MRLMYVGTLEWGCTSLQRYEALRALARHAYAVDLRAFQGEYLQRTAIRRVQMRFGIGRFKRRLGDELVREALRYRPDLIWVDQGNCVPADAIRAAKARTGALAVHYTADSVTGRGWGAWGFADAIKQYDVCITTKPHECDLWRNLGARAVVLSRGQGYDPSVHRPVDLAGADEEKYSCDIVFVGQRMTARARSICALVDEVKCTLKLYGRHWDRGDTGRRLAPYAGGWLFGDEYAKALSGAKICLAFLNREAGDTSTTRSVEIGACGGFMLGERTPAHAEMFKEGEEAEFFGSDEELIAKVAFYLRNEDARLRIARAGSRKVASLRLTWGDLMEECVEACTRPPAGTSAPDGLRQDPAETRARLPRGFTVSR